MVVVLVKEVWLVVVVDDLYFCVKDVVFKAHVFNRHGTFDRIANKNMKNLDYAYLHCDLLNKTAFTPNSLKVKSLQIGMSSICMFMKGQKFWHWVKVEKGFWKRQHACCHYNWIDDHCVINHYFWTQIGSHVFSHGFH
jgi:hypothetical protein